MPGTMFEELVSSRARAKGAWYTLPLSFVVHTAVLAILVAIPLLATDVLPLPRSVLQYTPPAVMPIVEMPQRLRPVATPAIQGTVGAPVVAPETIAPESGIVVDPGAIETTGLDGIVGLGPASVIVEALPPPAAPVTAPPIRLSSIRSPARTKYVAPVYPEIARTSRVQGVVIIEAIIGVDGRVERARVLRSHQLLDEAALAAVREWEYTPTLLNGTPTAVIMTVTVVFTLN